MTERAFDEFDPPPLAVVALYGVVSALGGVVAGVMLSLTPLAEVGVVVGVLVAPALAVNHARREGANAAGCMIVAATALVTFIALAWLFGASTVS